MSIFVAEVVKTFEELRYRSKVLTTSATFKALVVMTFGGMACRPKRLTGSATSTESLTMHEQALVAYFLAASLRKAAYTTATSPM